ncbi:MAG TPA: DUF3017 domain-containing protein [Dermatophilaceae bacterium]|nr:DUF3017 domain-containing protein [Dermatophilaceae bacterium]
MTAPHGRPGAHLRAWWVFAGVLLAGLLLATLVGRMLVGGLVMALAFLFAAAVRGFGSRDIAGGLQIRGRTSDVLAYLIAAVLVLGAVLAVDLGPVRR